MTRNEIWKNPNLTKREKAVLTYQTPASLRRAQLKHWELEDEGRDDEAEASYDKSFKEWEAAGRPNDENIQF